MADPREQELLEALSAVLQEYLSLGSETPVAAEAEALLSAIGGGGEEVPPAGAEGVAPPMEEALPPEEGLPPEGGGDPGMELMGLAAERQSAPANDYRDFGAAREGAMSDLKENGGKLADLKKKRAKAE